MQAIQNNISTKNQKQPNAKSFKFFYQANFQGSMQKMGHYRTVKKQSHLQLLKMNFWQDKVRLMRYSAFYRMGSSTKKFQHTHKFLNRWWWCICANLMDIQDCLGTFKTVWSLSRQFFKFFFSMVLDFKLTCHLSRTSISRKSIAWIAWCS